MALPAIRDVRRHFADARLVVAARSPDGVVEALERHDRSFVLGVQWHPEDQLNDPQQRGMFEAFREAVEKRTGS